MSTPPPADSHPHASPDTDTPTKGEGLLTWAGWLAPVGLIVIGLAVAAVFFLLERWRRGSFVLGAVAVWAAMVRVILPEWRLGVLVVRGRYFDAGFLAGIGVLIMFMALSVDDLAG